VYEELSEVTDFILSQLISHQPLLCSAQKLGDIYGGSQCTEGYKKLMKTAERSQPTTAVNTDCRRQSVLTSVQLVHIDVALFINVCRDGTHVGTSRRSTRLEVGLQRHHVAL